MDTGKKNVFNCAANFLRGRKCVSCGSFRVSKTRRGYVKCHHYYMKQELWVKYYIRYADDFVILSEDKEYLKNLLGCIESFIEQNLHLSLHENKVYIKTYSSGVDFLGWIHFPYHRQIRTSTKRKILRNTKYFPKPQTINSYRGLLSHGDTYNIQKTAGIAVA